MAISSAFLPMPPMYSTPLNFFTVARSLELSLGSAYAKGKAYKSTSPSSFLVATSSGLSIPPHCMYSIHFWFFLQATFSLYHFLQRALSGSGPSYRVFLLFCCSSRSLYSITALSSFLSFFLSFCCQFLSSSSLFSGLRSFSCVNSSTGSKMLYS